MIDPQLKSLAVKINDLIQLCEQLEGENRTLKFEAADWMEEREQLVEKTEVARRKVESMIVRLKALEQDS